MWIKVFIITLMFVASSVLFAEDNIRFDMGNISVNVDEGEDLSVWLGYIAFIMFVILNAPYYYSMILKELPKDLKKKHPELKKMLKYKKKIMWYHYWINPVMIFIAWIHGITADYSNLLVWIGWGVMVFMSVTGMMMHTIAAKDPGGKTVRLLHMQHLMSGLLIASLVIGHIPLID